MMNSVDAKEHSIYGNQDSGFSTTLTINIEEGTSESLSITTTGLAPGEYDYKITNLANSSGYVNMTMYENPHILLSANISENINSQVLENNNTLFKMPPGSEVYHRYTDNLNCRDCLEVIFFNFTSNTSAELLIEYSVIVGTTDTGMPFWWGSLLVLIPVIILKKNRV